jgi:PAS domain S-box-containing protein
MDASVILDWIGLGIIRLDRDFRITYSNGEAADLLKRPGEELVGQAVERVIPGGIRESLMDRLRLALEQGSDLSMEEFFPEPVNLWLSFRCRPFDDGLMIAVQDITEKRQAAEALERSHSVLSQAEQTAHLGAWDIELTNLDDMNSNPLRWTDEVYRIFGYEPGSVEVTTELFFERVHPEDRQKVAGAVARALSERRNYSIEHRIVRPDGSERIVLEHAEIAFDEKGKPLRMVGTVQDMTGHKAVEDALIESKAKLEAVIESMNAAVFISDADGNFLELNDAAAAFHRFKNREECCRSLARYPDILELFFPDGTPAPPDMWVVPRALRGETVSNAEYIIRKKDTGEIWWGIYSFAPIRDKEGRIVGSVTAAQDITERKLAEEELRKYRERLEELVGDRTTELEHQNEMLQEEITERRKAEEEKTRVEAQLIQSQKIEALGSFAGGIAHEINNILYPTIINTEMLLEEAEPGTGSYEMLKQNLQNAYRQRDLIKQILSFSRQSIQKFSPVRIVPLLENTLGFIRSTLPATIEIRCSIDAPRDTITGDAAQIQQVIMNLCRNAADALESRQGIIEVSLKNTHLDRLPAHPERKAGEYLELSVSDTGKGMPPDIMDRIFDPFFTTKGVGKGSGMGLSVVHGILKKHGGDITVRSEGGKGSRFTIYLPLLDREAKTRAHEGGLQEESRGHILLVDDEDVILQSLKRALERMGYTAAACSEPGGALDLFRKDPGAYDLVITDMTMPRMTGLDLGKEIKEIRPDVPVILCTGFSDLIDEKDVEERGFSGMLVKPTGITELKKAVGKALEESKGMSPTY